MIYTILLQIHQNDWINKVLGTSSINKLTTTLTLKVAIAALFIAAIFTIINIGWRYLSNSVKGFMGQSDGSFFDFNELSYSALMMLCITLYIPFIMAVYGFGDIVYQFTKPSLTNMTTLDRMAENSNNNIVTTNQKIDSIALAEVVNAPKGTYSESEVRFANEMLKKNKIQEQPGDAKKLSLWTMLKDNLFNLISQISMFFLNIGIVLISGIVRTFMIVFAKTLLQIFTVLGPLAFAFSILPAFRNNLSKWFGVYLNILFTFTTINIIDAIMFSVINLSVAGEINGHLTLYINLVCIVLYCMSFWITSFYVGSNAASAFISKSVGMASAAMGLFVAGKVGGSVGKTMKSQISNSMNAANQKNAIEEN